MVHEVVELVESSSSMCVSTGHRQQMRCTSTRYYSWSWQRILPLGVLMLLAVEAATEQQPAFGSVHKAEEAMVSLLNVAGMNRAKIEAAARSVDGAGGELVDAQMHILLPLVARLLEPTIREHFVWRDADTDVPTAEVLKHNFLAFMLAFDAHAHESAAIAQGLRSFHTMLSVKAVATTAGHASDEL